MKIVVLEGSRLNLHLERSLIKRSDLMFNKKLQNSSLLKTGHLDTLLNVALNHS